MVGQKGTVAVVAIAVVVVVEVEIEEDGHDLLASLLMKTGTPSFFFYF